MTTHKQTHTRLFESSPRMPSPPPPPRLYAPPRFSHLSDSALGHTAELFARQLRTTSVLAAETDISRIVFPALARELSHACRRQRSAEKIPVVPAMEVQQQQQAGIEDAQGRIKAGRAERHVIDTESLREAVPKRLVPAGEERRCGLTSDETKDEALWAPVLAVFRAVDAILSGGGRPRLSFVRRSTTACWDD